MSHLRKLLQTAVRAKRPANRIGKAGKKGSKGVRGMIVMKNKACYRHCLKQLKALGVKPEKTVHSLNAVVCRFHPKADLKSLEAHAMVKRVERDRKMSIHALPERSAFRLSAEDACASIRTKQVIPWGIARIQAPGVWGKTQGAPVRVAVLDTGISRTHPDLRVVRSFNCIAGQKAADQNGHGTHVAGTIAALNNRFGVVGTAPRVKLYAVKAFDKNGTAYTSDIAQGLAWCIRNKMNVVNMSFGMKDDSAAVKELIRRAYRRGIVLVASCGNDGTSSGSIDFPGRLPEVIAVAAATSDKGIAGFSSRGTGIAFAAPGVSVCSTYPGKTYRRLNGTSMAAPHVSGSAALLLARNRKLSPGRVKGLLQASAVRLAGFNSNDQGSGLVRLGSISLLRKRQ